MSILVFFLTLPLAVSTLGAMLRFLDDAPPTQVLHAVTWRLLLTLALMWFTDAPLSILTAFVTILALQILSFCVTRAFPTRR
ncbi:MAG: hypothetical protein QF921_18085 [Pseudomonadales bacterium]|jgi:phosphate/sulfate permease|nr:hypothetical protein [Pseudomonadales bacterium]MDP6470452.1 hypothetical protein [Pseudomonadales bacterium]MDP6827754.1 hypothetical protein [Pseudomonadales bacterium]MDP6973396.1 hypothetical protein [Pseudomonadales bacterium]|tara:strand:- start:121 stop:366 length:246 start_codon:yes stop_codon:yes gene_type:complete